LSAAAAVLRIAARDMRRARARSLLVVSMIALPVLGAGAADVLWRTFQLSHEQAVTRYLGAADARADVTGSARIVQNAAGHVLEQRGDLRGRAPDPASYLPAGSRVLRQNAADIALTAGAVTSRGEVRDLAYQDRLARGIVLHRQGRPARSGGEIVLSTAYARRLGVGLGGRVTGLGRTLVVVGLVDAADRNDRRLALVAPGGLSRIEHRQLPSLVQAGRPLTWDDVRRANAVGVRLRARDTLPGTPPLPPSQQLPSSTLTGAALVVGMVLLEIVLLAGPAFAVGAKRQSRELALLAATGGSPKDLRRAVLGGGLLLGVAGGLAGVLLGTALGRVAVPQMTARTHRYPGPFDVHVLDLLGILAVGVVTAVLAAVIPARNASRQDVVAALTGRRGQVVSRKRVPALGLAAAACGTALALHGARQLSLNTILAGSIIAELGLVATTPFLVGLSGRLGPLLPLGPRLALRDASRNRLRAAPAVSAVLAAVAGSVAVGTYLVSMDRYREAEYRPTGVSGSLSVPLESARARSELDRVKAVLEREIPGAQLVVVTALREFEGTRAFRLEVAHPTKLVCPLPLPAVPTRELLLARERDPACQGALLSTRWSSAHLVGGPEVVRAVTGARSDQIDQVLAAGGMVGLTEEVERGTAQVRVIPLAEGTRSRQPWATIPAVALPRDGLTATVLSPAAAADTGLPIDPLGVVALRDHPPSDREEDRARRALQDLDVFGLQVERGYHGSHSTALIALVFGSGLLVLGASGIATGLAAADGRADLATLAAVGASPTTRRTLAASQSAVTAVLGTVLGVVAGLVPAIGMVRALNAEALASPYPRLDPYPLVLPWANIVAAVVLVPLLAAATAAVLTRSRLPLVRRVA
jgi:putative ABC transport system permease protein